MAKTPSGKEYKLVSVEDQGIQCCYLRGFMPVFDNKYVDAHLIVRLTPFLDHEPPNLRWNLCLLFA